MDMHETETVPVLFRKGSDGDITAVFPTIPHDYTGNLMTCYAHIGQHSACSRGWLRSTRPATADEYQFLFRELRSIGYSMRVVKKITRTMRNQLLAEAQH
jgi:hypothetical protein